MMKSCENKTFDFTLDFWPLKHLLNSVLDQ